MKRTIVTVTNILGCIKNIGHSHNLTTMLSQMEKGRRNFEEVKEMKFVTMTNILF